MRYTTTAEMVASLVSEAWLITDEGRNIIRSLESVDLETLQTKGTTSPSNARTDISQSAVIINVIGPIMPYNNLISDIMGWCTIEGISKEIVRADRSGIDKIIFYIDSPGGRASCNAELAELIKTTKSPTAAYAADLCASAAYWIASQCDSITAAPTAILGSVGVKTVYMPQAGNEIVSKNAPGKLLKRPAVQSMINQIESVMIASIADGRGVTADEVIANYGNGGVFVGQQSVDAGLADNVGFLKDVVSSNLSKKNTDSEYDSSASIWSTLQNNENTEIIDNDDSNPEITGIAFDTDDAPDGSEGVWDTL